MALAPDLSLTPELVQELERVVARLPDAELVDFAHASSAFQAGGFRATQPSRIRTRVGQLALAATPIEEALRRLLARYSLNRAFLAALSSAALADHRADLEALFGAPRLLLGLLLDERAHVREMAARWARVEAPAPLTAAAEAAGRLRATFAQLSDTVAGHLGAGVSVADAGPWSEEKERLQAQLRESQASLRQLKSIEARAERRRVQLTEREAEVARANEALAASEAGWRGARRAAETAQADLARERQHAELRVRALVEARLASEFAGWLERAPAAASEAATGAGADDLLARAAAALANQAGEDRLSGNRAALRARLNALEQQLAACRDAAANAMRPLPELVATTGELAAEVQRLRRVLGAPGDARLPAVLAAQINAAPAARLSELRALVDRLREIGALDDAAAAALLQAAHRRQAMVTATAGVPADDKDLDPGSAPGRLRLALAGRRAAVLLVDGHNTLFSLQARYMPPQERGTPDRTARARLVDDLVRLTASRPACRAWVVFDGPQQAEESAADNVRVSFSGGEGENRADRVLTDTVRFFRQSGDAAVLLVTNDGALSENARRLGALILPPTELLPLLREA